VYLSVPSNFKVKPNHLTCHLIYCPVFPTTPSIPSSPLLMQYGVYINSLYIYKDPKINILLSISELFTYINLPCRQSLLINFYLMKPQNWCWVLPVDGIVRCNEHCKSTLDGACMHRNTMPRFNLGI